MFIDTRTLPKNTTISADVCIVGAGAAGITLARELAGQQFEVCLLESGGLQLDIETQLLYRGTSVGFPYLPMEATRLRYFGGTTNHWGGASRPLDPIDFQARDWVPYSGWPFDQDHLLPFYQRAHALLQLGPVAYSAAEWREAAPEPAAFAGQVFENAVLQQSPPTRFGEVYRADIERAPNVRAYLNANVLEIETFEAGNAVRRLRVASLARNDCYVTARMYVLATGGIENARLLLLSDKVNPAGVGNGNGLVGRFFMEHPIAGWGKAAVIAPLRFPLRFYHERVQATLRGDEPPEEATLWGFIAPSEQALRRHRLLNCGIAVRAAPKPYPTGVQSARYFKHSLEHRAWPDDFWQHVGNVIADFDDVAAHSFRTIAELEPQTDKIELMYWAEPLPNPNSRVYLAQELDALFQRRAVLDWRLTDRDRANIRTVLELLAVELGKAEMGRLRINPAVLSERMEPLLEGSFHHMGTTRMHNDAKQGVVNADCRLHEVSNLYIAGSSVFPTAGHANPTLTITALAVRLADHLKQLMQGRPPEVVP